MPSEKRRRQDEARLTKQFEDQAATKKRQRSTAFRNVVILVVVLAVGGLAYSFIWGGSSKKSASSTTTSSTATTAANDITVTYPGTGATITGATPCPKADGSSPRTTSFAQAPPTCITKGATYTATLTTSQGVITLTLDANAAPIAVNNFVVLARYHYYDGVPFHRIVPGFVDQAGTPVSESSADGPKTPGYTIKDELPDATKVSIAAQVYTEGTLAVANTGSPNTGSGQWFIVVGNGGQQLSLSYTVFGKVTGGLDVVKTINGFGDTATNGTPTKQVTISKVTITQS
jgi:peptidyl-prolyl cis-trans isomerase B (cyclophilin B)